MSTPTELPSMRESLLDVAGKKIFVAETGEGPPLVLLHGGGPGASGVSNYARNIAALAKEYRVVVPDLPGYGRSSKGIDRADPFGEVADRIRGLLDRLGLDKAHFVGNSLGGACALRLALDTPGRVDRMILMGPAGIGATRGRPTPGLNSLLDYYTGRGLHGSSWRSSSAAIWSSTPPTCRTASSTPATRTASILRSSPRRR